VALSALFAVIAGGLAIGQNLPYTISSFRGITKPSRVASSINLASNVLTTASMAAAGTRAGMVLPIAFVLSNILSVSLAIKFGHSRFTKSDAVNASLAAVALVAYLLFGPYVALAAMAVVTTASCRSVIQKLRDYPGSEDALSWVMVAGAMLASLGAILAEGAVNPLVLFQPTVSLVNVLLVSVYAIGPERLLGKLRVIGAVLRPVDVPTEPLNSTADLVLGA